MKTLTRRNFITGMAAGAGAAALGLPRLLWADGKSGKKPNVLFLAIDDLNDWIGCLGGHPDAKTPNLDRLAKMGTLFTHAYCSAPLCNASRASLLTGLLPSTTGVYTNYQPWRPVVGNTLRTLPQAFMDNGYAVAGGGKIFHDTFNEPASFHEYFDRGEDPKPPKNKLPLNGFKKTTSFDWGPIDVQDADMADGRTTDWAVGQLARKHDKPWFLGVGFYRPHLPWYVPKKYFDLFPPDKVTLPTVKEDDLDDVPDIARKIAKPGGDHKDVIETDNWRRAVAGYLACIAFADNCVGRVLDALEKHPDKDNTIIVLWSDHGWHLGEKLHWRKFALWEEATRNPLMLVVPGVTKPNTKCSRPVTLVDLYPTLVELAGLPENKTLEGRSLVPLLHDPDRKSDRPALSTFGRNNHSVRTERWRYIRYKDGSEELYDHDADELEWHNLASKPEHAELKRELAKWFPTKNAEDAPMAERGKKNAKGRKQKDD